MATRDIPGMISQAGASIQLQGAGEWIANLSPEEQEAEFYEDPTLKERWDPVYGDRQTEIVLIGIGINQDQIEQQLDRCLLTDLEMNEDWSKLDDPLPKFNAH